jgi:hypothetical protein
VHDFTGECGYTHSSRINLANLLTLAYYLYYIYYMASSLLIQQTKQETNMKTNQNIKLTYRFKMATLKLAAQVYGLQGDVLNGVRRLFPAFDVKQPLHWFNLVDKLEAELQKQEMSQLDREVADKAKYLQQTYNVTFHRLPSGNYRLEWNRQSPYYSTQTLGVILLNYSYTLGDRGYTVYHTDNIERFVRSCFYAGVNLPCTLRNEARSLCIVAPLYEVSTAA